MKIELRWRKWRVENWVVGPFYFSLLRLHNKSSPSNLRANCGCEHCNDLPASTGSRGLTGIWISKEKRPGVNMNHFSIDHTNQFCRVYESVIRKDGVRYKLSYPCSAISFWMKTWVGSGTRALFLKIKPSSSRVRALNHNNPRARKVNC